MLLPLPGRPNVFQSVMPTLVPNFDRSIASGKGTLDHQSPIAFLAANPRVDATCTATIGGSATTGDILTIVVANPLLGRYALGSNNPAQIALEYTVQAGDTLDKIADEFAALACDNANLQGMGLRADVLGAVITFRHNGPCGNLSTLSTPTEGPATITVGGTALTGDTLAVLFNGPGMGAGVLVRSNTTTAQSTSTMATNLAAAITANATLAGLGISAAATAAVITLTIPASEEPVTLAAWVNTIAPTATIGGSATTGDVVTLTFTNSAIAGSPLSVNYTVKAGDTLTLIAAGLVAAMNASAALIAAGISATNSAAVISIAYQPQNGQLRFSSSVSGSATETVTFTATPTETLAIGTSASETITLGASGVFSGGSGPVYVYDNFEYSYNSTLAWYKAGDLFNLPLALITLMVNSGGFIV